MNVGSVRLPTFDEVAVTKSVTPPAVLTALHCVTEELKIQSVSMQEFCEALSVSSVLLGKALPPRGHVDGGALASTTDRKDYLWCCRKFDDTDTDIPFLKVADDTVHRPTGVGFLKVPCRKSQRHLCVRTYHTPEIPATILSPHAMARAFGCDGYCTYSNVVNNAASLSLRNCTATSTDIEFTLTLIRGLLFTDHMVLPTPMEQSLTELPDSTDPQAPILLPVNTMDCCKSCSEQPVSAAALTRDQERALWHMRVGHCNERAVTDLHHFVDGVPNLPRGDPLHRCPMCLRAKLHKADKGPVIPRKAEFCWQHVQCDFGFFVVKSAGRKTKAKSTNLAVKTVANDNVSPGATHEMRAVTRSTHARRLASPATAPTVPPSIPTTVPPSPPQVETVDDDDDDELVPSPVLPSTSQKALPTARQKHALENLLTHEGPSSANHKRCKGCPFNLKVQWSAKETTWEPLSNLLQDVPRLVVEYARKHSLLDNPHWKAARDLSLDPSFDQDDTDAIFDDDDDDDLPDGASAEVEFIPLSNAQNLAKAGSAAERHRRLVGVNGETCCCLIADLKSGSWKVSVRRDKAPPLDFFQSFIARHAPTCGNRTVRFDQGGELGNSTEVRDIFERAGYEVQTTSPDSSSEIGQVERPHRAVADGVRTMLFGAGLAANCWPCALLHFVKISNCMARGDRPAPAITMCTGRRMNLSLLKIFGSRICASPTSKRDAKVDVHARSGVFLGCKGSFRKACYCDDVSRKVKTARHVAFDEGWNDSLRPPPCVRFLKGSVDMEHVNLDSTLENLDISLSPFNKISVVNCILQPARGTPLGFQVEQCPKYFRACISAFARSFGKYSKDQANKQLLGACISKIGDRPIFSPHDVDVALRHCMASATPPSSLPIHLAMDEKARLSESRPPALHLRPVDLRRAAALPLVAGEGNAQQQRRLLRELAATPIVDAAPCDPDDLVNYSAAELLEMRKLSNDHMTPEERNLKSFTRKNLQQHLTPENFQQWVDADRKQLDAHFDAGTVGHPIDRPKENRMSPSQVFRVAWARLVKASGIRKARACLDGSRRAAPWSRNMVQTYSSCVEIPCLRAFVGVCVNRGCRIFCGDVDDACQQSPPPSVDCYLEIDDAIEDWCQHRFGITLDRKNQVIPLFRALQGHPEAGVLWERLADDILINKMGFQNTAHEKNLHQGLINGQPVLVCRQVDDFAVGTELESAAKEFFRLLRQHVETEYAAVGKVIPDVGVFERCNGIDITQTRDCVKVGCESCIDRLLQTHGWDSPSPKDSVNPVPLNTSTANALMTVEGPREKTPEAMAIAKECGFSYRNVLGELICAFAIARLDIGHAVCFLARFSDRPHKDHFAALKGVCKCLRATKDWGIMHKRPKPLVDLPDIPFAFLDDDPNLPPFPELPRDQLVACLDAAHATDLTTRRSVTGCIVFFCGAAVACKSRLQPIVATSSTEAEFYAAVTSAKVVKCLRHVLTELDAMRLGPSPMCIDNQAAMAMINESRPTPRARHVEIQHFAIQQWCKIDKDIFMKYIPGVINSSDGLTKPLGWVLHSRHARRGMGHCNLGSPSDSSSIGVGEGVGAQDW